MSSAIAAALRAHPDSHLQAVAKRPRRAGLYAAADHVHVAPILFSLDKFAEVIISDSPKYLAPSSMT